MCVCESVYIYIYIYKILVLYKWLTCNDMVQTEGAGDEGGRGPSTWDRFIQDGVGDKDIAVDSYNHYKVYMNIVTQLSINDKNNSTLQIIKARKLKIEYN